MKKILSLVLVIALVLGSFSFAFGLSDIAGHDSEEAVETLVALGVINGFEDGTFRPENTVTRAQMAKMLIVALGYEELVTGTSSSFSDTNGHWADKYIAFAAGQKIVNGYPNGTFKPDATVKYDEAITMIVRALGYSDDALQGTWPTNYKIKALDLEITDGVKMTTGGADRGGVAKLIFNALDNKLVYINADDEIVKEDITLLDRLGEKSTLEVLPAILDEDASEYVESKVDLEAYMYETLEIYTIDDVVVYVSDTETATVEGDIDAIDVTDVDVEEADEDIVEFDAAGVALYFNGAEATSTTIADLDGAVVKVVFEADEDGDAILTSPVGIVATMQTEANQIANEYDEDDFDIDGIDLPITTNDEDEDIVDLDNLTVMGDATSLEEIKENDVVNVYSADDVDGNPQEIKIVVTRSTVVGKLAKIKDSNTVVVDGATLDISSDSDYSATLGDDGIFFLDEDGEIFAYDVENNELTNYAVVIDTENGTIDNTFGEDAIDKLPQIKIAKANGETVVYDLNFDLDDVKGATLDGTELITVSGSSLVVADDLSDKLVLFDTNSDGEIDELESVTLTETSAEFAIDGSKLGSSYRFVNNTIILDKTDDYKVIDLEDLEETVTVSAVVDADSSFGNLEIVIVEAGTTPTTDGTFAIITDVDDILNADDEAVEELTVLVDGEEVTYLTDDDYDTATSDINLVELTINTNDEVESAVAVVAGGEYAILTDSDVDAIDANDALIRIEGTNYEIADNATVYVATYDADDASWTIEAGDLNDIEDDSEVKAYDLDVTEDDGIEVIFVIEGDARS